MNVLAEKRGFGLPPAAREMARFGEVFRNFRTWQGQAVIPSEWTDESVVPRCASPWGGQYFNALGPSVK